LCLKLWSLCFIQPDIPTDFAKARLSKISPNHSH
jgi:hypothetical protein